MEDYAGFEPQIGEIRAVRTFRIGPDGRLYPLYSDQPWSNDSNRAICNRSPLADDPAAGPAHAAPEPDCTCGYYAFASVAGASEQPHARHVLGVVACWGKIIAGTRGIRAEHARVEALWMSSAVPAELVTAVAAGYPTTAIYTDGATKPHGAGRDAMLAEHPPTPLDCYEAEAAEGRARRSIVVRAALVVAIAIGSLPGHWIWQHDNVRYVWAAELCFFAVAALLIQLNRKDMRARARMLLYAGASLWLIAPFAGSAGVLLLRWPILQITTLGLVQRHHLNREARRFPARIARLEH